MSLAVHSPATGRAGPYYRPVSPSDALLFPVSQLQLSPQCLFYMNCLDTPSAWPPSMAICRHVLPRTMGRAFSSAILASGTEGVSAAQTEKGKGTQ